MKKKKAKKSAGHPRKAIRNKQCGQRRARLSTSGTPGCRIDRPAPLATLQPFFRELRDRYTHAQWMPSDPVQFPNRYSRSDDQELVAFIACCFAYGKASLVLRAMEAVLAPMGQSPAGFVRQFDGTNHWPGFYHRFHHEDHVVVLIKLLRQAFGEYGSLSEMFRRNTGQGEAPLCERVLDGAARWLRERAAAEVRTLGKPELERGMKFFFNAPSGGSACKRMVMFLRWVVRKDEVDLGIWDWMRPADLVIPADTHVARIGYYLRLRGGKEAQAPNWRMAREITASLREINPDDPVSYDFAISRLGILDICKKKYAKSICERCPVESGCRFSNILRVAT